MGLILKIRGFVIVGIAIVLILGALARALFIQYPGLAGDVELYAYWGEVLVASGFSRFYYEISFCDYPPGYLYMLWAVTQLRFLFPGVNHVIFLKLPAIIFDLAAVYFVYRVADARLSRRHSLLIAALVALNPMMIFNSTIWGQMDIIFTLFVVLCVYFLTEEKYELGAAAFALALLVKPQALLIAPLLLYVFVEKVYRAATENGSVHFWMKKLGSCAVVFLVVFYIVILPFGGTFNPLWIISLYFGTINQYSYVSLNAYNFWWAIGSHWIPTTYTLGPLTYSGWGWIANGFTVAACGAFFFKYKGEGRLFFTGALLYTSVFMLSHRMHERYLFPAVLLFIAAYVYDKKPLTLALGLYFTVHNLFNLIGAMYWDGIFIRTRTVIAVLGVVGLVVAYGYAVYRVRVAAKSGVGDGHA